MASIYARYSLDVEPHPLRCKCSKPRISSPLTHYSIFPCSIIRANIAAVSGSWLSALPNPERFSGSAIHSCFDTARFRTLGNDSNSLIPRRGMAKTVETRSWCSNSRRWIDRWRKTWVSTRTTFTAYRGPREAYCHAHGLWNGGTRNIEYGS